MCRISLKLQCIRKIYVTFNFYLQKIVTLYIVLALYVIK